MSERSYPHITRLVFEQPWAILPGHLAMIRDLVQMRINGERLSDEEIQERLGAQPASQRRAVRQAQSAVAVIPMHGTIVPKASMMTQISGGTSIGDLRGMFAAAMGDPDVGAIVFDVDSPGGSVDLVPEFAADIRSARGKKPMLAVSNTMMASAAYWLASQTDEIAVSPSSLTGSIGVFAAHQDLSAAQEQLGVKTTFISAGKYKTEGNSSQPLDPEARDHIQSLVDSAYSMFTTDVSKGRRVNVAAVRSGYGEGRVLDAKTAVSEGLADRVATLEQTIGRAAALAQPAGQMAAVSEADQIRATMGFAPIDDTRTDQEGARGDASFADEVNAVLCMAEELVASGRPLTAAKRSRLESLGERIQSLVAVKDPSNPDLNIEAQVAAMRARHHIAIATNLRSVQ
jgi:signal peptide peptidase SppA